LRDRTAQRDSSQSLAVEGREILACHMELFAVEQRVLGGRVATLAASSYDHRRALDFLFAGY
jgi:hypothetical protein